MREAQPYRVKHRIVHFGGFVLLNGSRAAVGHCESNGSYPAICPSRVKPGYLAISEEGEVFVATDGEGWVRGALSWRPVPVEGVQA